MDHASHSVAAPRMLVLAVRRGDIAVDRPFGSLQLGALALIVNAIVL